MPTPKEITAAQRVYHELGDNIKRLREMQMELEEDMPKRKPGPVYVTDQRTGKKVQINGN
jgi:hypothetical protein